MKVFDLTMPIDENTPVFPGSPRQEIKQVATIEKDGWNEKVLTISSHFSTHIDAPFHMLRNGKSLDDFPMETFMGEAIVIDVSSQPKIEPSLDAVKKGDIVFLHTGNSKKAYSSEYFKNNPIITERTAKELIRKKVKIVGLDSFTPDNEPYNIHKLFFKNDILILENLTNIEKLVGKRFICYILPLKIKDADGAPCRVVGII